MKRLSMPATLIARLEADLRAWTDGHAPSADVRTQQLLERAVRSLEPDPLFRRRLRGEFLNRHVATREGHLSVPRRRREMGKLGRACLYASLMAALSVSAAGAASQDSLPGDALYGVKIQLEDVRMRLAPASARPQLQILALDERADELEALAARGAWQLVPEAAERVIAAELLAIQLDDASANSARSHAEEVLARVMSTAPASARKGLERAIANGSDSHGFGTGKPGQRTDAPAQPGRSASGANGQPGGDSAGGGGQAGSGAPEVGPSQKPKPPKPSHPEQNGPKPSGGAAPGASGAPSSKP